MNNRIIIKDGLLWTGNTKHPDNIINTIKADKIAQANGFMYVERMISAYADGTKLTLDDDLNIQESVDGC